MRVAGRPADPKLLVRDHDTKYVASFNEVFRSEGTHILKTPFRTPNVNPYATDYSSMVGSGGESLELEVA